MKCSGFRNGVTIRRYNIYCVQESSQTPVTVKFYTLCSRFMPFMLSYIFLSIDSIFIFKTHLIELSS